jgi:hypothetical protein
MSPIAYLEHMDYLSVNYYPRKADKNYIMSDSTIQKKFKNMSRTELMKVGRVKIKYRS